MMQNLYLKKIGYNLEGSEIGAAFGLSQLKKLEKNIKTRQENFKLQCNFFDKYKDFLAILNNYQDPAQLGWLSQY